MTKTSVGTVISLFISDKYSKKRTNQKTIEVNPLGIVNDKYYDTNVQRSVLITSLESYTLVEQHNIRMPFGSLGENILIDYNPYHLASGNIFEIGTTKLEISQNCTICTHLSSIHETLPVLLEKDRGIFAKVIKEGKIKIGDKIYLLS